MDELLTRIKNIEQRLAVLESATRPSTAIRSGKEKTISPKEFLLARQPDTDVATTFFLGCFAEYETAMESFSADDIKQLYRTSRVQVPTNVNATIDKNVAKGLFIEAEKKNGKKAWSISLSGEELYKKNSLS